MNEEENMIKENQVEPLTNIMESTVNVYAKYVIQDRAIPDVRDGLKPSQRRLLWTMYSSGNMSSGQTKKSARITGQCFVRGELVHTPDGLVPIEELEEGDCVLLPEGGTSKVIQTYYNPPQEMLNIKFDNGVSLKVTTGQEFRVLNSDFTTSWCKAKDLSGKRVLLGRGHEASVCLPTEEEKDLAYTCGLMSAEGCKNDRSKEKQRTVAISMTDKEPLTFVQNFIAKKGLQRDIHKYGREDKGCKDIYQLKFTATQTPFATKP